MLDAMSWAQLAEWQAYASIDPFGESRADLRSAQICAILANVNRDPKRRSQPYKVEDFMFFFDKPRRAPVGPRAPLTDPEQWAQVKRMAKVLAGGRG